MISLSQQHRAGMRGQFLRERLNLERPVEFRLEKGTLCFTHRVILPWLGIVGEILVVSESYLVVEILMFNQKVPINVREGSFSELTRVESLP